ncbi:MAG: HlyD family secretion protein [Acidobacteriaceae bacterium]
MRKTANKLATVILGIGLSVAFAAFIGCSHRKAISWQGYAEGDFVYVSSSQSGTLDHLYVARGETVALNTPLFSLESDSERDAERQARKQLAAAEAQLADLEKGKRPQELDVTRAQLQQALAEQQKSATQLTRDEAQYKDAGISQAALEASRALAKSDAAQVLMLRSELAVAMLPARNDQIRAQIAQVAAARAVLAQAAWKVNQKAVSATRSGLVFDTIYRVGEWVQAGSPVVQMLPPENLKVRFFVPEPLLGRLSLGQSVVIHCDGCAGNIPAKITYISDQAEYTPPVIYSNERRSKLIYMIEAHPSRNQSARLHPGQPVEVSLP